MEYLLNFYILCTLKLYNVHILYILFFFKIISKFSIFFFLHCLAIYCVSLCTKTVVEFFYFMYFKMSRETLLISGYLLLSY